MAYGRNKIPTKYYCHTFRVLASQSTVILASFERAKYQVFENTYDLSYLHYCASSISDAQNRLELASRYTSPMCRSKIRKRKVVIEMKLSACMNRAGREPGAGHPVAISRVSPWSAMSN